MLTSAKVQVATHHCCFHKGRFWMHVLDHIASFNRLRFFSFRRAPFSPPKAAGNGLSQFARMTVTGARLTYV